MSKRTINLGVEENYVVKGKIMEDEFDSICYFSKSNPIYADIENEIRKKDS